MADEYTAHHYLDLRGTPCPTNFVKCRLELENISKYKFLKVTLDKGEPELMVIPGLRELGYKVQILNQDSECITLNISCEKA